MVPRAEAARAGVAETVDRQHAGFRRRPPRSRTELCTGIGTGGGRWVGYAAAVLHRMSSLFCRTLREDPADAEVPSHRLLVRAGYVRRTAAGLHTWLPLGLPVLDRVCA